MQVEIEQDTKAQTKNTEAPSNDPVAKKKKNENGRDEVLSDYLASLGGIALFGPEEEKDFAARLLHAEISAWSQLLGEREVVEFLLGQTEMLDDKKFKGEASLRALYSLFQKSYTTARLRGQRKASSTMLIEKTAQHMRIYDDDRVLIDEALALLEVPSALTGKKAYEEQQRRRIVYEDARRERRRALRIRNQFVRANLRLVVSVARRFHHYRMPLIDLIQEGNLGLIKSVHRFDHSKGFRFSTYAHWWIRQAIERAIMNKGAQIRLPVHIFDARREVAKASHELSQKLLRTPTHVELAEALHISIEKLTDIVKAIPREPTSLDETLGDDEDRTVAEMISDHSISPCENVIKRDEVYRAKRLLHKLSPMEIDIIERRYGLHHDIDETLEEIGKSYSLSRERVRQIQVQGIRKMQRSHQLSAR